MKNTFLQPTDFQPQLTRLVQLEHEQPDSIRTFELGEIGKLIFLEITKIIWEIAKTIWEIAKTIWEVAKTIWEIAKTIWEVAKTIWEIANIIGGNNEDYLGKYSMPKYVAAQEVLTRNEIQQRSR